MIPKDRIKVLVRDGRIALHGEVDRWYQREEAENTVCRLRGVRAVSSEILVKPSVKSQDIKVKIESALKRNAIIDAGRIKVETEGYKVILSGTVRSRSEKDEARWAAQGAPGVIQVEDNLIVVPS